MCSSAQGRRRGMQRPDSDFAAIERALEGLPDRTSLLVGLFAFSPVAYQVFKADGHCLLVNDAFRTLFASVPPPEYNVLRDELAEQQGFAPLIRRAFAGETVHLPSVWYDPRQLEHVKVVEGRR